MDAAQYPGSTQLFSMAGGKSDIKLHKLLMLRSCWLLLPGCWCGHPITTLDIRQKHIFSQCAHWIGQLAHLIFSVLIGLSSVHTGKANEHTEY